jgi:PAS domain S-box-containing protein
MSTDAHLFSGWVKVFLAVAFIALLIGGVWFYHDQEREIREKVERDLSAIARLKTDQIEAWRRDQLEDAAGLQVHPFLVDNVARWLAGHSAADDRDLRLRLRSLADQHDYADMLLVSPDGQALFSLGKPLDRHHGYKAALAGALHRRRPVFTGMHRERPGEALHISVVAPLYATPAEQDQPPLAALILVSEASQFLYPLIQSWPTPSETAETLLVRRDGDEVLFLNDLRHRQDTALRLRLPLEQREVPAVMAVLGREGFFLGRDYRGVKVAAVILPVADSPWYLIAKVDESEVFAEWRMRAVLILALFLGLAASLVAAGLVLWQRDQKARYLELYRAEAALRGSIERQSVTLRAIGDAVIATDARGVVELVNPSAENLTGWPQDEAAGKPLKEVFRIVNEETREKVEDPVAKVMREDRVVGLANHTLLIARDGTERPIADSAAPIRDERGGITGAVLVFRDQSRERLAQRMTRIRLSLIEYAAAHTLDELMTRALDDIGELLDSPIGFFHFLGEDQRTLILQQWSTRTLGEFCPAEGKRQQNTIDQAGIWADAVRQKKPIVHNDYTSLPHKQGLPEGHAEVRRELVVPIIREGRVLAILGLGNKPSDYTEKDLENVSYLADVTWQIVRHKRADAESERLLSAIEQAGDMIVITDPGGIIRYVNPAFERVTGYTRQEAVGRNPRLLKSDQQDRDFYQRMWSTISSGGTFKGRMVNKRKDGTLYTEEMTISPVCDAAGAIVDYVAVKHDITEDLRLAAQYQQAQKMESVGRLAGGVAHDYNNMLSVIIGYTELALDRVDPADPLHADLEEIARAARRSTEITRQLLTFARKQIISPRVLDVNETVESMLRMLRRLIGESIELVWLPGEELWPVEMDPVQVDQILVNLGINARDAIADVGRVTIETRPVTVDPAYCAEHPGFIPGDFVMLAVSDNGCGMDRETLDNIFEPFFTTKEENQGTGLGLATVYGIVRQNGGFINVYSEPGQGTIFKIYLPRHAGGAEPAAADPTAEIPTGRQGETVLLVEDEPAILKMGRKMLEMQGYRVLASSTPGEALKTAGEHQGEIHLLITDVVMPQMNGRELADRLLALSPGIKTLFMSGYTANVIAHSGVLEKGVNFIQKPFSLKELGGMVRAALDR